MIPIVQTKVVVKDSNNNKIVNGNCWAAAIASILELPITEVPNFEVWFQWNDHFWWDLTNRFLTLKGYKIQTDNRFRVFHHTEKEWQTEYCEAWDCNLFEIGDYNQLREQLKDVYYFISGSSPRGVDMNHVTIWQNGNMVHDPHPTKEGILSLDSFECISELSDSEKKLANDLNNNYKVIFPSPYKCN